MITEFFMRLGRDVGLWFVGLLDWAGVDVPPDVRGTLTDLVNQTNSLGVWFPWAALIAAVATSLGVWIVCLGIKAARAVIAHIPFGFGGAG